MELVWNGAAILGSVASGWEGSRKVHWMASSCVLLCQELWKASGDGAFNIGAAGWHLPKNVPPSLFIQVNMLHFMKVERCKCGAF